jgi:aspartate aminotransferase-like enzyme
MYPGMEATIANLVEPGETIVVGNKGIWGARVCDMAGRFGGMPHRHLLGLQQENAIITLHKCTDWALSNLAFQ